MPHKQKIRDFITSNMTTFGDDIELKDCDNFFKLGFLTSLFAMKLIRFVEKEFNIIVEPEEMNLDNFSSINNISQLITNKQS